MKKFKKHIRSDEDHFVCPGCPAAGIDDFEVYNLDDSSWNNMTSEEYDDMWNGEGDFILCCKKCKTEFRVKTCTTILFDYFEEGEQDSLESLDEFGHEIL